MIGTSMLESIMAEEHVHFAWKLRAEMMRNGNFADFGDMVKRVPGFELMMLLTKIKEMKWNFDTEDDWNWRRQ